MGGDEPLDETNIHPESYDAARKVMAACGITRLGTPDAQFPEESVKDLGIDAYTLKDIEDAIRAPLRDYRDQFETAVLRSDVLELSDLKVGDQMSGTVRNVVDFGAFVDIGLHETGLIHVSELSDSFVSDPMDVVKVGDIKEFTIIGLDNDRKRISLSLKSDAANRLASPTGSGEGSGSGKKRVVVVKKGSAAAKGGDKSSRGDRSGNGQRREKQSYGSDDGMYYNPFAALLKK
jgi:uncharacterized protein